MKKRTKLIAASLSALVAISGVGIAANNLVGGVTKANYNFEVNGEMLNLPANLLVLSKDNTTYVPLRFLSENLGSKVAYKQGTIAISNGELEQPSDEQTKDKIVKLEEEVKNLRVENEVLKKQINASNSVTAFRPIPTYAEDAKGFRTTINRLRKDTTTTAKMDIKISNTDEDNIYYLNPLATELIVDGKTYTTTADTDLRLFSALEKEGSISGAIAFDGLENVNVKGVVRFYYKVNNMDEKTIEIFFDNTK